MGFDNRIFRVNGCGFDDLKTTLSLVFKQEGFNTRAKAWSSSPEHGFVLYWYKNDYPKMNALPGLNSELSAGIIWEWLQDESVWDKNIYGSWECDSDHDGSNKKGWLVYCDDWGHVDGSGAAICAIKPCYLWLGK